jgi:hypothetical protein
MLEEEAGRHRPSDGGSLGEKEHIWLSVNCLTFLSASIIQPLTDVQLANSENAGSNWWLRRGPREKLSLLGGHTQAGWEQQLLTGDCP